MEWNIHDCNSMYTYLPEGMQWRESGVPIKDVITGGDVYSKKGS